VKSLVLDTSVAVAWYLPETFGASARAWQQRLLDAKVRRVVPSLHYWGFANVLRTYVWRGELDRSVAAEVYALHLDAPLVNAEPDRHEVLETALEYYATVDDAVCIALSRRLSAPLLTAERKTTPWVVRLGRLVESVR
jgi:predicted nucleic acid-binding protein